MYSLSHYLSEIIKATGVEPSEKELSDARIQIQKLNDDLVNAQRQAEYWKQRASTPSIANRHDETRDDSVLTDEIVRSDGREIIGTHRDTAPEEDSISGRRSRVDLKKCSTAMTMSSSSSTKTVPLSEPFEAKETSMLSSGNKKLPIETEYRRDSKVTVVTSRSPCVSPRCENVVHSDSMSSESASEASELLEREAIFQSVKSSSSMTAALNDILDTSFSELSLTAAVYEELDGVETIETIISKSQSIFSDDSHCLTTIISPKSEPSTEGHDDVLETEPSIDPIYEEFDPLEKIQTIISKSQSIFSDDSHYLTTIISPKSDDTIEGHDEIFEPEPSFDPSLQANSGSSIVYFPSEELEEDKLHAKSQDSASVASFTHLRSADSIAGDDIEESNAISVTCNSRSSESAKRASQLSRTRGDQDSEYNDSLEERQLVVENEKVATSTERADHEKHDEDIEVTLSMLPAFPALPAGSSSGVNDTVGHPSQSKTLSSSDVFEGLEQSSSNEAVITSDFSAEIGGKIALAVETCKIQKPLHPQSVEISISKPSKSAHHEASFELPGTDEDTVPSESLLYKGDVSHSSSDSASIADRYEDIESFISPQSPLGALINEILDESVHDEGIETTESMFLSDLVQEDEKTTEEGKASEERIQTIHELLSQSSESDTNRERLESDFSSISSSGSEICSSSSEESEESEESQGSGSSSSSCSSTSEASGESEQRSSESESGSSDDGTECYDITEINIITKRVTPSTGDDILDALFEGIDELQALPRDLSLVLNMMDNILLCNKYYQSLWIDASCEVTQRYGHWTRLRLRSLQIQSHPALAWYKGTWAPRTKASLKSFVSLLATLYKEFEQLREPDDDQHLDKYNIAF